MRLIDADRLKRQVEGRSWRAKDKMVELIDDQPTIRVGENTCKHRTPDGVCKLYTDEHFTSFCIDGPCPHEEPIPDVKHGRWIVVSDGYGNGDAAAHICECSECKDTIWVYKKATRRWNYCPNCGAVMEEQ